MSDNSSSNNNSAPSTPATKLNAAAKEFVPKLNPSAVEFSPSMSQQMPQQIPQQMQQQMPMYPMYTPNPYEFYYPQQPNYYYQPYYPVQQQPPRQSYQAKGKWNNNHQAKYENSYEHSDATAVQPANESAASAASPVQEVKSAESSTAETSVDTPTVQFGDIAPVALSLEDSMSCASQTGLNVPAASLATPVSSAAACDEVAASASVTSFNVKDDYEVAVSASVSAEENDKDKAASSAGEWTRKKETKAEAEDSWRREPSMADRNDGIIRYTKMQLMQMNSLKKIPAAEVRNIYPHYSKTERFPKVPKGWKIELVEDNTPHEDEAKIFSGEKVFKFDANKHTNDEDPEVIIRKATKILNVLSEENFDRLSVEFMNVGIDKAELMGRVVDMIVKKAQVDQKYCGMYANLAKKLATTWSVKAGSESSGQDNENNSNNAELGETFRNLLLSRAKEEFEVDRKATLQAIRDDTSLPLEDREEKEIKLKKRYDGMMIFVGELYGVELLRSPTIAECMDILYRSGDEIDLVCLNTLIQTVGAKYDAKKSNKAHLDKMFANFEVLISSHNSSRVRFLLDNLKILRSDNWQQRGKEPEKPVKAESSSVAPSPMLSAGSNKGFTPKPASSAGGAPRFGSGDARKQAAAAAAAPSPVAAASAAVADEWSTVGAAKKSGKAATPSGPAAAGNNNSGKSSATRFGALQSPEKGKKASTASLNDKSPKRESKGASKAQQSSQDKGDAAKLEIAIPDENAATESNVVGADGSVDKETLKKTKIILDEFINSNDINEAVADLAGLVHPNGMGEVFKYLMNHILEKKDEDRAKFCEFINSLNGTQSGEMFSKAEASRGVLLFLNDLDEIAIDVPRAETYFAAIFTNLVVCGFIKLELLSEIPDENNFSFSARRHTFLGDVINRLTGKLGAPEAEALYRSCGVPLRDLVTTFKMPRESDEAALNAFKNTYSIAFEF